MSAQEIYDYYNSLNPENETFKLKGEEIIFQLKEKELSEQEAIEAINNAIAEGVMDYCSFTSEVLNKQNKKILALKAENQRLTSIESKTNYEFEDLDSIKMYDGIQNFVHYFRPIVSYTSRWIKDLQVFDPAVTEFFDFYSQSQNYQKDQISEIVYSDYSLEVKVNKIIQLFDQFVDLQLPRPVDFRIKPEDEIIYRNLNAYNGLIIALMKTLADLQNSSIVNRDRCYYALFVKYFDPVSRSAKKQLNWFKNKMDEIGDDDASCFSGKTFDRYVHAGITYLASKFPTYYREQTNPDCEKAFKRIESIKYLKDLNSDYFLLFSKNTDNDNESGGADQINNLTD